MRYPAFLIFELLLRSILPLVLISSPALFAATLTVTNTSDDRLAPPEGSLRKTLADASPGDVVQFEPSLSGVIKLQGAELVIDKDLTIEGPGRDVLAISGESRTRVINVEAGRVVAIAGLSITNGDSRDWITGGGGILNGGNLTIHDCDVRANQSQGNGGGILNTGTLAASRCLIRDNWIKQAETKNLAGSGGGIYSTGTLSLDRCAILRNQAGHGYSEQYSAGSGGSGGGIYARSGSFALCTIYGNRAGSGGSAWWAYIGGGGGYGGGASVNNATFVSCTITGNLAGGGGMGGHPGGSAGPSGAGAGISGASVTLRNTIVAGNYSDVSGSFTTAGHNVIGCIDGSTGISAGVSADQAGTKAAPLDPKLGGVSESGGTFTCALSEGSPALDAGDDTLTGVDQRGYARRVGMAVDVGAFERQFEATFAFAEPTSLAMENVSTHSVVVSRSGSLADSASVAYYFSSAVPNYPPVDRATSDDYIDTPGVLTFAPGVATQTIEIPIIADGISEKNEEFQVSLASPAGAELGQQFNQTITIFDPSNPSKLSFASAEMVVGEAGGFAVISLNRSGRIDIPVTVEVISKDGTAIAGEDYVAFNGTVTFSAYDTEETVKVPLLNDSAIEGDEKFSLELRQPGFGAELGALTTHEVTIQSEDVAPGVFEFAQATSATMEGAGSTVITVVRGGNASLSLWVDYATFAGSASAGSDYRSNTGTLYFSPGEVQKTITIPIVNDVEAESDESFTVRLVSTSANATLGAISDHIVTIQSDDPPPAVFEFAEATSVTVEGAGSAVISVVRGGSTSASDSVLYYLFVGTASNGSDYQDVGGKLLTFGPGETQKTITVPIVNDFMVEPDEWFSVDLRPYWVGNAQIGPKSKHIVAIQNDDVPSVFEFASVASVVQESASSAVITVARAGGTQLAATVQFATSAGSATAGADFVTTSGTLSFAPGVTQQNITVPLLDDFVFEPDETFVVTLSDPSAGATLGAAVSHEVSVQNDDTIPVVSLSNVQASARESESDVTVVVTRQGGVELPVSVQFATASDSATGGEDFEMVSGTIDFPAGVTARTIKIPLFDDGDIEGDESFALTLTNPANGAMLGEFASQAILIRDDDAISTRQKAGYHGIAKSEAAPGLGGLIARTTAKGRVSGSISFEGQVRRFSGQFNEEGAFETTIRWKGRTNKNIGNLQLQIASEGDLLVGTYSEAEGTTLSISARRDLEPLPRNTVSYKGSFNAILRGDQNGPVRGFIATRVAGSGAVLVSGALPDGTPVTSSSHVDIRGQVALFAPVYRGNKGYLAGTTDITEDSPMPYTGQLAWRKPPANSSPFTAGVPDLPLSVSGARYVAPPRGGYILDDFHSSRGTLNVFGGGLPQIPLYFLWDRSNQARLFLSERHALKFRPATGQFSGMFQDTDGKWRKLKGICVQQPHPLPDVAEGLFVAGDSAGMISLSEGWD